MVVAVVAVVVSFVVEVVDVSHVDQQIISFAGITTVSMTLSSFLIETILVPTVVDVVDDVDDVDVVVVVDIDSTTGSIIEFGCSDVIAEVVMKLNPIDPIIQTHISPSLQTSFNSFLSFFLILT